MKYLKFYPKSYPVIKNETKFPYNETLPDFEKFKELFESGKNLRWLFAGDSITHGCWHVHNYRRFSEYFNYYLHNVLSRNGDLVLNTAVSGSTTRDCMQWYDDWIVTPKGDVVFLCLGMNDCCHDEISLGEYINNMAYFIDDIRNSGSIPIVGTPQPSPSRDSKLKAYNDALRKLCKEKKVILVDMHNYWATHKKQVRYMMNDRVHPNEFGHLEWCRILLTTLDMEVFNSEFFTFDYRDFDVVHSHDLTLNYLWLTARFNLDELLNAKKGTRWLIFDNRKKHRAKEKFYQRIACEHFEEELRFIYYSFKITGHMRYVIDISDFAKSINELVEKFDELVLKNSPDILIVLSDERSGTDTLCEMLNENDIRLIEIIN